MGLIALFTAATSALSDVILLVPQAEGLEQTYSSTLFVEPSLGNRSFIGELEFDFPTDVVAGSERAEVMVVGQYQRRRGPEPGPRSHRPPRQTLITHTPTIECQYNHRYDHFG